MEKLMRYEMANRKDHKDTDDGFNSDKENKKRNSLAPPDLF